MSVRACAAVGLLIGLAACGVKIDPLQDYDAGLDLNTCLSYQTAIKPVLERHCTGCHASTLTGSARNGAPATVNLDSYAGLLASVDRVQLRIVAGSMPPGGGIPQGERSLLVSWVNAGKTELCASQDAAATDLGPSDAAGNDRTPPSCVDYGQVMKPIIDNRCTGCHASTRTGTARNGAPAGVDFDTYAGAMVNIAHATYHVIGGQMPPGGGLPENERALWVQWVEQGTLEACSQLDGGLPDRAMGDMGVADTHVADNARGDGSTGNCVPYEPTVRTLLATYCTSCHASTLTGYARNGAPASVDFDSYSSAVVWATPARIRVGAGTMPPSGGLPQAQRDLFAVWVGNGTPQSCPGVDGGAVIDGSSIDGSATDANFVPTCSSNSFYLGGFGAFMNPGDNCLACHLANGGPDFATAGTVMGARHDLNDCNGVPGVTVEITDGMNMVTTLVSNTWGNFVPALEGGTITPPYSVRLIDGVRVTSMPGTRTDPNCMNCHTMAGANGALGRIVAP